MARAGLALIAGVSGALGFWSTISVGYAVSELVQAGDDAARFDNALTGLVALPLIALASGALAHGAVTLRDRL